jgi:TPR repeat protein
MDELQYTVLDIESKLNKLSLIKFCRDKAEKYLGEVTQKLANINLVIMSLLGKRKDTGQDKLVLQEISKLNQKILYLEENFNKKEEIVLGRNNKVDIDPVIENKNFSMKTDEILLLNGLKAYLGLDNRVDIKKAHDKILESSSMGNTYAKVMLAKMYEKGEFVEKSQFKALKLFKEASDDGNSAGSYMMGLYSENELSEEIKDSKEISETALEYYIKSAEANNSDAYAKLGMISENGLLNHSVDYKSAVEDYKQAIEIDENPEALNSIGSIYYKGIILKQNYSLAVDSFERASKLGNIDALNNLGLCFEYGKGVERSLEKAMTLYKQAAEKLHPVAISNQAILSIKLNKIGNKKDYKEAIRLLSLSLHLEKNNKDAFYYLGYLFENGLGANESTYLAYLNYKKAAKLGHHKAKTKVGVVLFNGLDDLVLKDEQFALKLLTEAAESKDPEALNYLGLIYEKGTRSVDASIEKSKQFYQKSSIMGCDNASINLVLLNCEQGIEEDKNFEKLDLLSKKGNTAAKAILDIFAANKSEKNREQFNFDAKSFKSGSSYLKIQEYSNKDHIINEKELFYFDNMNN